MKKKILTLSIVLSFALTSFAQTSGFIESRNSFKAGSFYPHAWTSITSFQDTSKLLGVWSYGIVGQGWGELLAGPAYRINAKSYWEMGPGIGFETGDSGKGMRYAAYLWQESEKNTFLFNVEYSTLSSWYILYYNYKIKNIGLGVYSETAVCTGPRFEWKPTKSLLLWTSYGYDFQSKNTGGIIALRWVGL